MSIDQAVIRNKKKETLSVLQRRGQRKAQITATRPRKGWFSPERGLAHRELTAGSRWPGGETPLAECSLPPSPQSPSKKSTHKCPGKVPSPRTDFVSHPCAFSFFLIKKSPVLLPAGVSNRRSHPSSRLASARLQGSSRIRLSPASCSLRCGTGTTTGTGSACWWCQAGFSVFSLSHLLHTLGKGKLWQTNGWIVPSLAAGFY